jgi:hypothetical protein
VDSLLAMVVSRLPHAQWPVVGTRSPIGRFEMHSRGTVAVGDEPRREMKGERA